MLAFAKRWAKQKLDRKLDVKSAVSQDFAYGQWSFAPGRQTVADFEAALNATLSGKQYVADLGAALEAWTSVAPTPSPSEGGGSLDPVVAGVVAVLAVLAVAAVGGLGFLSYHEQREEEVAALLGTGQESASVCTDP